MKRLALAILFSFASFAASTATIQDEAYRYCGPMRVCQQLVMANPGLAEVFAACGRTVRKGSTVHPDDAALCDNSLFKRLGPYL